MVEPVKWDLQSLMLNKDKFTTIFNLIFKMRSNYGHDTFYYLLPQCLKFYYLNV